MTKMIAASKRKVILQKPSLLCTPHSLSNISSSKSALVKGNLVCCYESAFHRCSLGFCCLYCARWWYESWKYELWERTWPVKVCSVLANNFAIWLTLMDIPWVCTKTRSLCGVSCCAAQKLTELSKINLLKQIEQHQYKLALRTMCWIFWLRKWKIVAFFSCLMDYFV